MLIEHRRCNETQLIVLTIPLMSMAVFRFFGFMKAKHDSISWYAPPHFTSPATGIPAYEQLYKCVAFSGSNIITSNGDVVSQRADDLVPDW